MLHVASVALIVALFAAPGEDVLCLKDGRVVDGVAMERREDGILLRYQNGDVLVSHDLVQDAVLAADLEAPPADDEEALQRKNGMVRFEGKWMPEKKRAELLRKRVEDRQKAIQEARAHSQWGQRYIEETRNFRYEFTIPPYVFAEYRDALEAFFAKFSKTWKLETPRDKVKLPVNIYADRKTFNQVGGVSGGVLAYYRFIKPWDLNGYHDRLDPEYSKQVFYHEFTHHLQQLVDLDFSYPHFPNESVAEYYGASRWDPETKQFTTGMLQEGRLWEIQADIAAGEPMTIERLITTERAYEHYTWGWSLVHFLMNHAKYKPRFERFFLALSKGKGVRREEVGMDNLRTCTAAEVWRVFQQELGLKSADDVRKLETEWREAVDALIAANTSVSGKEKAAFKAKETGRKLRAKRFFQEAIDAGSRNPRVFHEYADLLLEDGKRDQGLATLQRAIALDPLNGWLYGVMGRALKAAGQEAEGRRWIRLGKEVGYDDPWIELQIDLEDERDPDEKPKRPGEKGG